jgi:hypothetical protein
LPAGAIVALLLDLDDGAVAVLLVPFCVLLLELEDEDDFVVLDELEVDCACSPGADIVRQSANAANRPKNLL